MKKIRKNNGIRFLLTVFICFGLCVWGILVYRTNAAFEEKVLVRDKIDIGPIRIENATGEIYDPAAFMRVYPGAREMILMAVQPGFNFFGAPGQFVFVSCKMENRSDEKVSIGNCFFPLGIKTDDWYNGNDPYMIGAFNEGEIGPGESVLLRIPVLMEKKTVSREMWKNPQKEKYCLVLRDFEKEKYIEIPIQLTGTVRATQEENDALMHDLEMGQEVY